MSGIGQGDTIVIAIDGKEVGRLLIPETEHFLEHSDRVFTINLDAKAIAEVLIAKTEIGWVG